MTYSELLLFLRQHSYMETAPIGRSGDFSVLGDTIAWWPVTSPVKRRSHFFGETLEFEEKEVESGWERDAEPVEVIANEVETEHGTIRPADYLVHPRHGVGIFDGVLTQNDIDGNERRYVSLQYAGNDRLLFPWDRRGELMPYIGTRHPRLTRLYSKSWETTKEKVAKDLIKVARELLKTYAQRQMATRPPYVPNPDWEAELDRTVDFSLTEDQQRSLKEIVTDLTRREYPMDRLLCGDVGFGKTEVALRAASQVMAAGKQVAFIAPTTVLAEQHFALLQQRFAGLPVTVERMSRLSASRDKEVIERVRNGQVDLLVGTHRLLGKDVEFKDLGMLILDEEQKFGVGQKEHLKKLRPHIDVLSLSATPIPRTLSMSLSGLRGLSILRTAPSGRLPVQTEIINYSDGVLQKALVDELARGGQVYVVHNRVQSLGPVADRVTKLLAEAGYPQARIGMAHGQLPELALAKVMGDFLRGEIDVLVASSIVEHGLDSPSANALVVLHSEWFGLSDLYQLRGRVGRRSRQAYSYFMIGGLEMVPYGERGEEYLKITDTARRRLLALKEADELGSGWSVALRDLEIRGGGNILGNEQHGSMEAIGLLLYSQLLQEEIGRQARKLGIDLFRKPEETD